MREKIAGILFALILLCLAGCGKEKEAESGRMVELQGGERVTRELTEKVTLDAVIELPEDWNGMVESCKVKRIYFNGKTLAERLYPEIPKEEWQDANTAQFGDPDGVYYEGDIWVEEGQKPKPGMIHLALGFHINTDRAEDKRHFFRQNTRPDDGVPETDSGMDLDFMPMEEAIKRAEKYWTEVVGLEGVHFLKCYSVTCENLFAEAEYWGETEEEFWKEDNCYDIRMEQMVNGLPLVTEYSRNVRRDGLYVPSGELVTIVNSEGIEYVSCNGDYEILETEEKEAAPMEKVYGALERKFKMAMTGEITIDEMRLAYYPFPVSADPELREYEFVPAWCFTFSYDGIPSNIYINAVTGEEIAE